MDVYLRSRLCQLCYHTALLHLAAESLYIVLVRDQQLEEIKCLISS